ncbi:MAG: hypothetical protein HY291_08965, partial [Planctomycetes bacterium]|nr:hypothetical protein [Planctomycetota bacterium]
MPIVHTCKACGSSVSEAEILAGTAARRGKSIYCAECSALILEPAEVASASAGQSQPAPRKAPPMMAQPLSPSLSKPAQPAQPIQPPQAVAPHAALASEGIEVVDEYEILSSSAPVEDLAGESDDDADVVDADDGEEEEAEEAAPKVGAPRRKGSLGKRGAGPAASATRKPSRRMVRAGERDRPSRSKIPASAVRTPEKKNAKSGRGAPAAAKGNKEVFFKSGAANRQQAVAKEIEDVHADTVDSNVLQSVREMTEKRRKGAGHSEKNIRRAESQTSNRSRRSVAVRTGNGNSTGLILGVVGGIAILAILAICLTGGTKPTTSAPSKQVDEDNMSGPECMQRGEDL